MNRDIPLKDFCEAHTQAVAGKVLGCSQGAISQMLKAGRQIFISVDGAGNHDWYEIRRKIRSDAA